MRNTSQPDSGAWATFVTATRKHAGISQAELGRRSQVSRETVWRWETGRQKPENIDTVLLVAQATGWDEDDALRAAGLKAPDPMAPEPESAETQLVRSFDLDPGSAVVKKIMSGPWDLEMKKKMLRREREWVDRAEAERIEQLDLAEEAYRHSRAAG